MIPATTRLTSMALSVTLFLVLVGLSRPSLADEARSSVVAERLVSMVRENVLAGVSPAPVRPEFADVSILLDIQEQRPSIDPRSEAASAVEDLLGYTPEEVSGATPWILKELPNRSYPERLALAQLLTAALASIDDAESATSSSSLIGDLEELTLSAIQIEPNEFVLAELFRTLSRLYWLVEPQHLPDLIAQGVAHQHQCKALRAYMDLLSATIVDHDSVRTIAKDAIVEQYSNTVCEGSRLVLGHLGAVALVSPDEATSLGLRALDDALKTEDELAFPNAVSGLLRIPGSKSPIVQRLARGLEAQSVRIRSMSIAYLETTTEQRVGLYAKSSKEQVYDGFLATYDWPLDLTWSDGLPQGNEYAEEQSKAIRFWLSWLQDQ